MTILSVGNCSFDHGQLQQLISTVAPDATLLAADTADAALAALDDKCQLVLVNRVFDRTGESGLSLIERIAGEHPNLPVMLISNYADAQQKAIAAGALPGFGKSQMRDPEVADNLRETLANSNQQNSKRSEAGL